MKQPNSSWSWDSDMRSPVRLMYSPVGIRGLAQIPARWLGAGRAGASAVDASVDPLCGTDHMARLIGLARLVTAAIIAPWPSPESWRDYE